MQPETYPSALDPGFSSEQIFKDIAGFVRAVVASDQPAFHVVPGEAHREGIPLPLGEWLDALPWWLTACEGDVPNDPDVACFVEACRLVGFLFQEGRRLRRVSLNTTSLRHARQSNSLVNAIRRLAVKAVG